MTPTKPPPTAPEGEFSLTPTVKFKPATVNKREAQALDGLTQLLNKQDINPQTPLPLMPLPTSPQIPGIQIQRGPKPSLGPTLSSPGKSHSTAPSRVASSNAPAARVASAPSAAVDRIPLGKQDRIFFTGRMKAGKDYCASAAGAKVFGFAEPLYALLKIFFATSDKDAYGAREFLQCIGQWGRGTITEDYPISPARAALSALIRSAKTMPPELCVDWSKFGLDEAIWAEALLNRISPIISKEPGRRYAITGIRFENELRILKDAGWQHWHVMCSDETRNQRLRAAGLDPDGHAQQDLSERVARSFDASVRKHSQQKQRGSMLRCIWDDEKAPCPSARIYTLNQWLQEIAIAGA